MIAVAGSADRVLAAAVSDLTPVLSDLSGHVLIVGGLMQRIWLHLRPVKGISARATADVDLGIDSKGLGLTSNSERIGPMLEAQGYSALPGKDGFRFEKALEHGSILVDLFVAKGASRTDPPILEKGIETLAAPGLAYALSRSAVVVKVEFIDGSHSTAVELPLPTLEAAFVLKAALVGVRTRPDRIERDTVDALMLAAACILDREAVRALATERHSSGEVRRSLMWLREKFDDPDSAAVGRVIQHFQREQGIDPVFVSQWALGVAARLVELVDEQPFE